MDTQRIAAVILRQLYLMRSSPARVLPVFAWVAIDIILWGFITRFLNTFTEGGYDFVPVLLGAVLLWDFFSRVMHGVSTAFFEDVWSRNFLNLFATPMSIGEYLGGLVLTSIGSSLIGLVIMLVLASAVFGLSYFAYGVYLLPFLMLLFVFGIALGIFSCAAVLRFGPAAEWLIWPVPAMISPFAAVFYPLETLPDWMQRIAWLLPPAHVFEGMRSIVAGEAISGPSLLWGGALDMLYLLLAVWTFVRVYRQAIRSGLLARYSAESV